MQRRSFFPYYLTRFAHLILVPSLNKSWSIAWGQSTADQHLLQTSSLSPRCHHLQNVVSGAHFSSAILHANLDILPPPSLSLMDSELVITITAALNKYFTKACIDTYLSFMVCCKGKMKSILNIKGHYEGTRMCLAMLSQLPPHAYADLFQLIADPCPIESKCHGSSRLDLSTIISD